MNLRVFDPAKLTNPKPAPPRAVTDRTVGAVLDWFLRHDTSMRSEVARTERERLFKLFREFTTSDGRTLGDSQTADVIGADLVEFLRQKDYAQWTRRRWCATIKRPFNEAVNLGLIERNPFKAVSERKGDRGRDITWDEFRAILRDSPPTLRRVLIFLRFSGARPEELRTLEWEHIDWPAARIVKKRHKTADKTGKPRCIPLNTQCLRLLSWIKRKRLPGPFVFLNAYRRPWSRTALCKAIRDHRRKLKLPEDVKLYGCRHAFVTEGLMSGVDLATMAEIVGHANISTTQTYIHLADKREHLAAAMEKAVRFGGQIAPELPREKLLALLAELMKCASPERQGTRGDVR